MMRDDANLHAEGLRELCNPAADAPPAEQHEVPPAEAVQALFRLELPRESFAHMMIICFQMACKREHQRHRVLGDFLRAIVGHMRDHDAEVARSIDIDISVPRRMDGHDAQARRGREHFARQRQKCRHERIGLCELRAQLLRRSVGHDPDIRVRIGPQNLLALPGIAFIHRLRVIAEKDFFLHKYLLTPPGTAGSSASQRRQPASLRACRS